MRQGGNRALRSVQRIDACGKLLRRNRRHRPSRRQRWHITASRTDHVQMPPIEAFRDAEAYYATLAHEMTHWTRHPTRLDRDFGRKRYGDEGYAMEELVAELGSAFLCADLELTPEVRRDHAAYIASWLKVLKNDKRAIFSAASHAQRAADFLHGLQARRSTGGGRVRRARHEADIIVIDGRAYEWRQLCELRRAQLEARRAAQGRQLALFALREDCRPAAERTAAGKFTEPSLLGLINEVSRA